MKALIKFNKALIQLLIYINLVTNFFQLVLCGNLLNFFTQIRKKCFYIYIYLKYSLYLLFSPGNLTPYGCPRIEDPHLLTTPRQGRCVCARRVAYPPGALPTHQARSQFFFKKKC